MPKIITDISNDEEAFISTRKKRTYDTPPFRPFGAAGMNKNGIEGIDATPILKNLSRNAHHLFWETVELMDITTNIRVIRGKQLTPSEKGALSKAYKELNKVTLMKRVKREYYMLNPKVLYSFEHYKDMQDKWDSIP